MKRIISYVLITTVVAVFGATVLVYQIDKTKEVPTPQTEGKKTIKKQHQNPGDPLFQQRGEAFEKWITPYLKDCGSMVEQPIIAAFSFQGESYNVSIQYKRSQIEVMILSIAWMPAGQRPLPGSLIFRCKE